MGLSIHYSGRFKEGASLKNMIEEVKDVAEAHNWPYYILDQEFKSDTYNDNRYHHEDVFGIAFTPPECETVYISFLSNRRMASVVGMKIFGNKPDKEGYLYMLFAKTQYAGIEIHKLIIHLFKHLNKTYFNDFKMMDEGEYWETGDEKLLEKNFKIYNDLVDNFSLALQTSKRKEGESFEDYAARLMEMVRKRKDEKK